MSDDVIHECIEYCWGHRLNLVHPTVSLERRAIATPRLYHHLEPDLVCTEDMEIPGDHAISSQDVETPVPVQVVVSLLKVQEYLM